jgi:hypothetical protein
MKSLANNWLEFAHKDLQAASQIVSNAELTALTLGEMSPAEQSPSSDKVQIFLSQAREIYNSARGTVGR